MQETMLSNDPLSPIGSEGQQSEPENLEQSNARYQQKDYWGQLYGSGTTSYVNPTFVDPSSISFMPQTTQFAPPPPPVVPPQYGFNDFGSQMFGQHLGDADQGSSG